ncbi:serine hydrolase domain-containing protein [Paenibacillus allorhizosphaerae]|uniref:Beta-lactamase-related domain-containing protein n=1 Tax=Paenibacillus allorhizosphaerae TaxID=2849866 RepID=A0ABN7TNJ1_9BACL|nr:serine hydrolase [Paenibacillus allorhizosphaerae]CAG7648705.1 hypothetical protein PAECIP111802_04298 [Paenibacillus allorhizosphaerae]
MSHSSFVFPRCRPETVGILPSSVSAFLKEADSRQIGLHCFMLLRYGQVVAEAQWAPYDSEIPRMLFSLSKSFVSTAVGFAVDEGLLAVDDLVLSILGERSTESDDRLRLLRVEHLLTMSTGQTNMAVRRCWNSRTREKGNWVQDFLDVPIEHEPGTHFAYNSCASYLLSAIVQEVTGLHLLDYLAPRLFEPLGIEGAKWESCPDGIHLGGSGLWLKTEHLARFGQLYLQKGRWNGKQLLSEGWIREATSLHISTGRKKRDYQGYGYHFWPCRHGAFRADGAQGQLCIVMPDQEAVIAVTAGVKEIQEVLDLIWEHLLPGMQDNPLPHDDAHFSELTSRMDSIAYAPLDSNRPVTSAAERVSGYRYDFSANELHLYAASIRFAGDTCEMTLWNPQGEHFVSCGIGYWASGSMELRDHSFAVAASGMWSAADIFEMEWRFIETPYTLKIKCTFTDDLVDVQVTEAIKSDIPIRLQGRRI